MKKKLLFSLLLVGCLFILTGCKEKVSKNTITIKDSKLKYTTTFNYEKEDGFSASEEVSGGKYSEIEFKNEKENMSFDMYYSESTDTTAKNVKQNRKENQKYYKEYKFGEYDAYVYSNSNDDLYVVITLKEDTKEHKTVDLFVSIESIDFSKETILYDEFKNSDSIINFFNSIKNTVD